jgi:alkylhydroperoxidase family enzyme
VARLNEVPHEDLPRIFAEVAEDGWGGHPARKGGFNPPGDGHGFNPSGQRGDFFRVWANHPELFRDVFLGINTRLMQGRNLPPALREIAILRTAFVQGIRTVYALHYNEALWFAGIPREKSDEIATWTNSTLFDDDERAVLAYVDEVTMLNTRVQDVTMERLKKVLTDAQILEITYVIGLYTTHGYVMKALKLEWDDVPEPVGPIPRPADAPSDEEVVAHFRAMFAAANIQHR